MSLENRISQLRKQDAPPNEESAKAWIIQPILDHLGWASDDPAHVLYEHSVGGGRVDIALRTGGRPVAFLEAKAPGQDLQRHVTQVLQYAFHGGVDICVLTTGFEWWFYLPREKGPPEDRRFAVLRIHRGSPRECSEVLRRYIGRDALGDGSAERNAKEALGKLQQAQRLKEEIPKVWKEMQSGDGALLELIARRVKESSGLSATRAEVARVLEMESGGPPPTLQAPPDPQIADLRTKQKTWQDRRDRARAHGNATALAEAQRQLRNISSRINVRKRKLKELGVPQAAPQPQPTEQPPRRKMSLRPTSFRLWDTETPIKTWGDLLVGVFEAALKRHGDDFLYRTRPLWGNRKPWVSRDPGELLRARPLGRSGLHVEANLSAKDIKSRCHSLLESFGHSASDLEIRHD